MLRKLCRISAAAAALPVLPVIVASGPVVYAERVPEIVVRASRYVDRFVQDFSNVVAEERYVQESAYPRRRRELVSDFLLVTLPGSIGRYQFRDVREVDGAAVGDRSERLATLFLQPPADVLARAAAVARESERYNLADIGTLDQPLLAVGFLQSRYVNRFRYTVGDVERYAGAPGIAVRYVAYQESARPTIIRTTGARRDFPSRGSFLIEESTGRVVRSEVALGDGLPPPSIVTSFRFDEDLQMTVPVEMHDPLGTATYGRFRRFAVRTEATIRR